MAFAKPDFYYLHRLNPCFWGRQATKLIADVGIMQAGLIFFWLILLAIFNP
jgi:hypothetical protein